MAVSRPTMKVDYVAIGLLPSRKSAAHRSLKRELAEIVFVEAALSVGGPLRRKGSCDVDFKGAGVDQMILGVKVSVPG